MREIHYVIASSLDGFIAGPKGEFDWITIDPDIDFQALYQRYDTLLMGRHTFELMNSQEESELSQLDTIVFSRTLQEKDHPAVTILRSDEMDRLREIRSQPGKHIWLFGGSELFRSLIEARLVDRVEVSIVPIILGNGIPMISTTDIQTKLKLSGHRVYPNTGIITLEYDVKTERA